MATPDTRRSTDWNQTQRLRHYEYDPVLTERAKKAGKKITTSGNLNERKGEKITDTTARDDDLITWNGDLMATEFVSDGSVFFCIDSDNELGGVKDDSFPSDDYR